MRLRNAEKDQTTTYGHLTLLPIGVLELLCEGFDLAGLLRRSGYRPYGMGIARNGRSKRGTDVRLRLFVRDRCRKRVLGTQIHNFWDDKPDVERHAVGDST